MNKILKIGIISVISCIAIVFVVMMTKKWFAPKKVEEKSFLVAKITEQEPLVLGGNVETQNEQVYHYDPQKGEITMVQVSEGQEVSAGDVLFEYDNEELSQEVADMNRQVERIVEQRSQLYRDLEKQRVQQSTMPSSTTVEAKEGEEAPPTAISNAAMIDQEIATTEKAIQELTNNIEDITIKIERMNKKANNRVTATISGVVHIQEEGKTNAQVPFIKVSSKESMIKAQISEYDYETIHLGDEVSIYVVAQDRDVQGKITFISNEPISTPAPSGGLMESASKSVSQYLVSVTPSEQLPNGFTVELKIPKHDLIVADSAVQTEGDQEYVYRFVDGVIHRQVIKREKKGLQWIVKEGLSLTDEVVINPNETLSDQMEIQVKRTDDLVSDHD